MNLNPICQGVPVRVHVRVGVNEHTLAQPSWALTNPHSRTIAYNTWSIVWASLVTLFLKRPSHE
jgi:hypothetical protein